MGPEFMMRGGVKRQWDKISSPSRQNWLDLS